MPDLSREFVVDGGHHASISNNRWRDVYAFVPAAYDTDGVAIFAGSEITAYVDYESARIKWTGEPSDFIQANQNRGKISGVVDGKCAYEKIINERLPLAGLRIAIARRRATNRVCRLLGMDPKPHFQHPAYQSLADYM
ncbi:MAG TPA: hypothetical protein VLE73_02770 [Candidatus Saccharimonadales bacterium]|nr:hypothetical protein [Candidatus Saccharimonadales bacterium]